MTKTPNSNHEHPMSYEAEKVLKDEASVSTQKTGKSYACKEMIIKFEMPIANPRLAQEIGAQHIKVLLAMLHSFGDSFNIFDNKS